MSIFCPAVNSHEMSSLISSEKIYRHFKMSSAVVEISTSRVKIFFFPKKVGLAFHADSNFHEMSNPIFWGKIKKKKISPVCRLLNLFPDNAKS